MHPRGGRGGRLGPPQQEYQMDPQREKAMRSIFVANIAFETTEEQLKTVLSEVGPVVTLKLILDPGTGKPRGFGFCEFEDMETAMSACRNLAGRELNGRPLRIDSAMNAPGENFRAKGPTSGPVKGPIEPPLHGQPVRPEEAPEAITKAVASLPPEQMFELMRQMKWCIQHTPQEARQLLLNNPQLAYALLQAQVVMRIVDLETAQKLLHRTPRGAPMHNTGPAAPPPHSQPPPAGPPSAGPPPPPQQDDYHHSPQYGPPRGRYPGPPPPQRGRGPPPPHGMHGRPPPPQSDRFHPSRGPPDHRLPPPPGAQRQPGPELSSGDQEKAALIMQLLNLTDEQIRMLPMDQRSSILSLKEEVERSARH